MKKNVIVMILTAVVFLSSVFLGFSTVYRIDVVWLDPITISAESTEEVTAMHEKLAKAYDKKSYFSVNDKTAKRVLKEFPYFRLTGFEKTAPNRIIIKVKEDEEVYAVPMSESNLFYILGEEGSVLGIRDSYENRLDGENNVLLKGFSVVGNRGEELSGDSLYPAVLEFCKRLSKELGGIRRNVLEVEVLKMTETIVRVSMREGVKIYIGNVTSIPKEKAVKAAEKYLQLGEEQRLTGRILVSDSAGKLIVNYSQKDMFEF